ncbi:hypothetical protein DPMN_051815 [Dreissena polymorpha]|uniref:Uncharacterized protein n=1 Tax=Dreissena polymorpha TaxID=45954 RepID=A0A9D4CKH4_DREPO|nr:hypothetical protein DPMN_051815 [Dreissena polymorpha]
MSYFKWYIKVIVKVDASIREESDPEKPRPDLPRPKESNNKTSRSSMLPKTSSVPGDLHSPDSTRGSMPWIIPDLETCLLILRLKRGNQRLLRSQMVLIRHDKKYTGPLLFIYKQTQISCTT